jgi:hypothetical protein
MLETASADQSCSMIFAGSLIMFSLPRWQISSLRPPSVAGCPSATSQDSKAALTTPNVYAPTDRPTAISTASVDGARKSWRNAHVNPNRNPGAD